MTNNAEESAIPAPLILKTPADRGAQLDDIRGGFGYPDGAVVLDARGFWQRAQLRLLRQQRVMASLHQQAEARRDSPASLDTSGAMNQETSRVCYTPPSHIYSQYVAHHPRETKAIDPGPPSLRAG